MAARSIRLALPMVALALLLIPDDAAGQYRYLCTSVPAACTYTGPTAPVLDADVCFSRTAGVRLMSGGSCPTDWWPYHVEFGEVVHPITNDVAAYIPLDNACDQPGLCIDGPPPDGAQEFPMCCTTNSQGAETCYDGGTCGGSLWWCNDGVCNDDGTITCFSKEPG